MTIDLTRPLQWTKASPEEETMLGDLQGNILKSHGRDYALHLLLRFDDQRGAQACLRSLAGAVTSAAEQLRSAKRFREVGESGGTFVSLMLSAAGYAALGIPEQQIPAEPAFRAGMRQRGPLLDDPPVISWDQHWQGQVHGILLIADDSAPTVRVAARRMRQVVGKLGGVRVVGEELGATIRNGLGKNIEHFGYADGISDPIMLAEDLPQAGALHWDPEAPLEQVLARDPGGQEESSFGSYVVFRKLEQNVRLFKEAEERLAHMLGLEGEDEERAGAMIVGRFEGGTPLILSRADDLPPDTALINDFSYGEDAHGQLCPFHAHIRKVNPRGESAPRFSESLAHERARRIVRRGIPYGERADDPNADLPAAARPTGGVGLLFIAYQRDIGEQFEHIQRRWANDQDYLRPGTGQDPLIGQSQPPSYRWPVRDGTTDMHREAPFSIGSFVMLRGGEYFFVPCISFLKGLVRGEM